MSLASRSEEEIGQKYDKCITDLLIKSGAGLGVGALLSLVVFKRKVWPATLSTGVGIGMAISNCQHEFKSILPRNMSISKEEPSEVA